MRHSGLTNPMQEKEKYGVVIDNYMRFKCLKEIGFSFDGNKLDALEAELLVICESSFNKAEQEKIKRK